MARCSSKGCAATAKWQIGFRLWAAGHRKRKNNCAQVLTTLLCCDQHKADTPIGHLLTPEGRERIAAAFTGRSYAIPDFSTAELVFRTHHRCADRCDAAAGAGLPMNVPVPTIFVDGPVHRRGLKKWCHLFSEDIAALHAFARRLGLKRSWFQDKPQTSWPHYDITEPQRARALKLGAVAADRYRGLEVALGLAGHLTERHVEQFKRLRCRRAQAGLLP